MGQHHVLSTTYGMTAAGNMRGHKQWVDFADFEKTYQKSFMEAYNFLNPDGEEKNGDDDEEEEEKPA